MIDRYGRCPNRHCDEDWNVGDILAHLKKIHAFAGKSEEEIMNIAYKGYGYNPNNPKKFSKVIAISVVTDTPLDPNAPVIIIEPDFYECPRCRQVWNADTGQQFDTLMLAKKVRGFYEYHSRELGQEDEIETTEGLGSE